MATNKIHFLLLLLFPYLYKKKDEAEEFNPNDYFSCKNGALVIMNDSIRAYIGGREYSHFTKNPDTGATSWIQFPEEDVRFWTKELVKSAPMMSAGKPGEAVIDEDTVPDVFWLHNRRSLQNEFFYLHLLQDKAYDMFIRAYIDTKDRYHDKYVFKGRTIHGDDLRGKSGMDRWSEGLLTRFDDQFYVRIAKMYFEATGIKANREWLEETMKTAIREVYPEDLAEATVKFVSLSDKANDIITNELFDDEVQFDDEAWPVKNCFADQWVHYALASMHLAMQRNYWRAY